MFDLWNEELTEEQEEELLKRAASTIERRKLTTPAIMFLEMHKPLAFIGANAAVAFSPFLVPVLGFDTVNDYSRLLKKPQNVERLLQRLERKPAEVTG